MRVVVKLVSVAWLAVNLVGCSPKRVAPGFAHIRTFSQASIDQPQPEDWTYSAHFDDDELVLRGAFHIPHIGPVLRADFSFHQWAVILTISTVGTGAIAMDDAVGYEVRIGGLPPRPRYDVQIMHVDSSAGAERRTQVFREEVVP